MLLQSRYTTFEIPPAIEMLRKHFFCSRIYFCFVHQLIFAVLLHSVGGQILLHIRGRVDDLSFSRYLSPFCFLFIKFYCTFSISYKILTQIMFIIIIVL